jgi:hypothetical protein
MLKGVDCEFLSCDPEYVVIIDVSEESVALQP